MCVKDRFPSLEHVVSAGFMTNSELNHYETTKTIHLKYWIPFVWFTNTLVRCRQLGIIASDYALRTVIDEMNTFRGCCGMLQSYDWISIPLVYTQGSDSQAIPKNISVLVEVIFLFQNFFLDFFKPEGHWNFE